MKMQEILGCKVVVYCKSQEKEQKNVRKKENLEKKKENVQGGSVLQVVGKRAKKCEKKGNLEKKI